MHQNTIMDYLNILTKIGLNENEISIYEALLNNGELSVGDIIRFTNLKRGDAYNKLYSLKKIGLIIQKQKKGKITFFPKPPTALLDISSNQIRTLQSSQKTLETLLPELMLNYSAISQKPAIRYFEGKSGLKQVYSLLNNSKEQELLLIRSVNDHLRPELAKIIDAQIKKQVRLGIKTKTLTPYVKTTQKTFLEEDKLNLVERRIIPPNLLEVPAQIMIWGNTVAISTLKDVLLCTVIDNKAIATTFRTMFEFIWNSVEPYHQQLVKDWKNELLKRLPENDIKN